MDLCTPKAVKYPPAGGAWPKVFYHAQRAPEGRVFEHAEEFLLRADEPGWSEQPLSSQPNAKLSLLTTESDGSASNGAQK